jgi:hypothetical protein
MTGTHDIVTVTVRHHAAWIPALVLGLFVFFYTLIVIAVCRWKR